MKTTRTAGSVFSASALATAALLGGACLVTGPSALSQTTTPRPNNVYAINSGDGAISGWTADSNFLLGSAYENTSVPVSQAGLPQDDAPAVVYQSQREGDHFSYIFTNLKPNTVYQITLHFAELYFSAENQRKFDVTINTQQVLTDFDIVANAGGPFRATAVTFFVAADAKGTLETDFTKGSVDQPTVSAVEIATRLGG